MNLNFKKKKKYFHERNIIVHKYDRFMILSCVYISSNRYELTLLLDYLFSLNENKTLIPIRTYISYNDYLKIMKTKFGVWIRCNSFFPNRLHLYIYHNLNNNHFIIKTTKHDNFLKCGITNQYNHKLVFKGFLYENALVEQIGGSYG